MSNSAEEMNDEVAAGGQIKPPPTVQKIISLSLACIASLVSFFLAWPWWRDFSYWAESESMWLLYFAVGFGLAVYVFYAFFGSVRTLFAHDAIERAELAQQAEGQDAEHRP